MAPRKRPAPPKGDDREPHQDEPAGGRRKMTWKGRRRMVKGHVSGPAGPPPGRPSNSYGLPHLSPSFDRETRVLGMFRPPVSPVR